MAEASTPTPRTRAWVMVKAEEGASKDVSYRIMKISTPELSYIIRADVVKGDYNVVSALDMESQKAFDEVIGQIKELTGIMEITTLVVDPINTYNPDPPQDADGYITQEEKDASGKGIDTVGPTGHNPWG